MKNNLTEHVQSRELVETLAAIEHQRWADWQRYIHQCMGKKIDEDWFRLAPFYYNRWQQQIDTPYEKLSEKEKQSDREQVYRYLPHLLQSQLKTIELVKEEIEKMKVAGGNYNCGEEGCCPPPKNEIEKEDVEVQMGYNSALSQAITLLDTIIQNIKLEIK